ncbi:hypothetical protein EVAR_48218_1, partial [Eumeta japonica]
MYAPKSKMPRVLEQVWPHKSYIIKLAAFFGSAIPQMQTYELHRRQTTKVNNTYHLRYRRSLFRAQTSRRTRTGASIPSLKHAQRAHSQELLRHGEACAYYSYRPFWARPVISRGPEGARICLRTKTGFVDYYEMRVSFYFSNKGNHKISAVEA